MGLPTSRNVTLNPASPVPSALLDALQDQIVGMKFPAHWRPCGFQRGTLETNITYTVGATIQANANAAAWTGPLPPLFPVGTLVDGVYAYITGTGGAQTVEVALWAWDPTAGGTSTLIADLLVVNPPAAVTKYTLQPGANPYTTIDGSNLYVKVTMPLLNTIVDSFAIHASRL